MKLQWHPATTIQPGGKLRWRQWLSKCGRYSVAVRIDGPRPRKYIVEIPSSRFNGWDVPDHYDPLSGPEHDGFNTKRESLAACQADAER